MGCCSFHQVYGEKLLERSSPLTSVNGRTGGGRGAAPGADMSPSAASSSLQRVTPARPPLSNTLNKRSIWKLIQIFCTMAASRGDDKLRK